MQVVYVIKKVKQTKTILKFERPNKHLIKKSVKRLIYWLIGTAYINNWVQIHAKLDLS